MSIEGDIRSSVMFIGQGIVRVTSASHSTTTGMKDTQVGTHCQVLSPLYDHVVSIHPSRTQMNTPHVDTEALGFPIGYFTIRSVATGRLLDIYGNETTDSSPIALWPAKEQSLVESTSIRPVDLPNHRCIALTPLTLALRSPDADNQVGIFTYTPDEFHFTA